MTTVAVPRPLEVLAGMQPSTDKSTFATKHWTDATHVRFRGGFPEKIGGWQSISYAPAIFGKCRSIYSTQFSNRVQTLLGTHLHLYNLTGATITNITPFDTDANAAADSLSTHFAAIGGATVFSTVNGSKDVVVEDSEAGLFQVGDAVTLADLVGDVNGIPEAELNGAHVIRAVGTGNYTIRVSTAATSSGSGGTGVTRSSGLVTVTVSNTVTGGDRVKIDGATAFGGIGADDINAELLVRNRSGSSFDVMTMSTATSAVTADGGSGTEYMQEIEAGYSDETAGQGYGLGLYGVGLYGVPKFSSSNRQPRTWFFDRFGDDVVATPGDGSGIYQWDGSIAASPTLVTNAPTDVNYAFVSDGILVTFGADSTPNRIKASDSRDLTNWVSSSTNEVFTDDIEGAGRFLTHIPVNRLNLIFTQNQTYTFRFIGLPGVWETKLLDPNIGIISPMARCQAKGFAFWMGLKNFYMYRGGNVEIIPANSQAYSTILNYVFKNLNYSQKSKCFAWYNAQFDEVWFHYPSATSSEPNRVARVDLTDFTWVADDFDRLAAEYPFVGLNYPRLIDSSNGLFYHELGANDDDAPMDWSVTSPLLNANGKNPALLSQLIPDSVQTGNITVITNAQKYPQSRALCGSKTSIVASDTESVPCSVSGRYWQHIFSGSALDQTWIMGEWQEELQAMGGN